MLLFFVLEQILNMPPKGRKKSKAEMMRTLRARRKMNPITHEEYKLKERERYQKRKEQGTLLNIKKLCARDQRTNLLFKVLKLPRNNRPKNEKLYCINVLVVKISKDVAPSVHKN